MDFDTASINNVVELESILLYLERVTNDHCKSRHHIIIIKLSLYVLYIHFIPHQYHNASLNNSLAGFSCSGYY